MTNWMETDHNAVLNLELLKFLCNSSFGWNIISSRHFPTVSATLFPCFYFTNINTPHNHKLSQWHVVQKAASSLNTLYFGLVYIFQNPKPL